MSYLLGAEQQAQSAASSAMSALMQTRLEETHVAQRVATERARAQQAGTQLMQDASFLQAEWEHARFVLECEKQVLHREHAEAEYAQQRAKYEATQAIVERDRVLAEVTAMAQERTPC